MLGSFLMVLYEVRERVDIGKANLPSETKEPIIESKLESFPCFSRNFVREHPRAYAC